MEIKSAVAVAIAALIAGGCGDATPYHAVADQKSGTLIINRYTGATYRVAGQQVLELARRSLADQKASSAPKSYTLGSIPNTAVSFRIRMRYLDNKMLYIAELRPTQADETKATISKRESKATDVPAWAALVRKWRNAPYAKFTARLHDDAGFVVRNIDIRFSDLSETVDNNDMPLDFRTAGDVDITEQTFNAIRGGSLGWAGLPR